MNLANLCVKIIMDLRMSKKNAIFAPEFEQRLFARKIYTYEKPSIRIAEVQNDIFNHTLGNDYFDIHFFEACSYFRRHAIVRHNDVELIGRADVCVAAFVAFGSIKYGNHL